MFYSTSYLLAQVFADYAFYNTTYDKLRYFVRGSQLMKFH